MNWLTKAVYNALKIYKEVIELFPDTEKASRSQSYINQLEGAQE